MAVNGSEKTGDLGLDDDEKGIRIVDTPGGPQEMLCVNESGLYSLIFKSRKAEARRFKRWVCHEVLPSIRRYGAYTLGDDRVRREQKRLRSDQATAVVRLKRKLENKGVHDRLRAAKAPVRTEIDVYNAVHRGQTGHDAAGLRVRLGLKPHHTPLDYTSGPCLSQGLHAQILAERICQDHDIPHSKWPTIFEAVARDLAERDLSLIGPGSRIGIRHDSRRGPILDVVRPLPA
ncbi:BRO-N domain-containing protein [Paludisphaera soli]|uniref:BRO-N domain-containing protein n=1 Tax=Paludisphaera soli TaxID=2712865 RepID=UPI001F0D4738